ncbi:MAG: pilus assembly protein PilP [Acidobacteriota bacterium]|nr:pilus assembly protein PilP [Acidobacteriota bacterium]MDQ3417517.1 pilus assembly protein PilP [Acidobacteriota bacterium]
MKHIILAIIGLTATPLAAQAPAAPPATQKPASAAAAVEKPDASALASAFTYKVEGRRDPFVSLVGRGSDPRSSAARVAGLPGMLINEVSLKGIMKERAGFVAMLQGPDKKTYVVRAGQRLLDGSVKSITADAVVFAQDVNDPLSLVKQREVRKALRSGEENRG